MRMLLFARVIVWPPRLLGSSPPTWSTDHAIGFVSHRFRNRLPVASPNGPPNEEVGSTVDILGATMKGRRQAPGTQRRSSGVRTAICVCTAGLLALVSFWNVRFLIERQREKEVLEELDATNRRKGGGPEEGVVQRRTGNDYGLDDDLVDTRLDGPEAEGDKDLDSPKEASEAVPGESRDGGGAGAAAGAGCGANWRPYHTILTAQSTTYQDWQSRIMYFHWKKQSKAGGPCSEMTGFTRLVAHKDGEPDGLENEIPSIFVREYTAEELARFKHFAVMNRPKSVLYMLANPEMMARFKEEYVMIAETDHVFMRPLPNLATRETPVSYDFGYMHASPAQQAVRAILLLLPPPPLFCACPRPASRQAHRPKRRLRTDSRPHRPGSEMAAAPAPGAVAHDHAL